MGDQKMNVVGGPDVVQLTHSEALLRLEQPMTPTPPVTHELKRKLLPVTAVGNVRDIARRKDTVDSRYCSLLSRWLLGAQWGF